jgi:hypothetical protein
VPSDVAFKVSFVLALATVFIAKSGLDWWSSIWAIIAGVLALVFFVFGIARWIWQHISGSELRHGLAVSWANPQLTAAHHPQDVLRVDAGVSLANAKGFPIQYSAASFSVELDGHTQSLAGDEETWHIPARQPSGFWLDPFELKLSEVAVPTTVIVRFRFHYGYAGRKPQRYVEGANHCRLEALPVAREDKGEGAPEVVVIPVVHRQYESPVEGRLPIRWLGWFRR